MNDRRIPSVSMLMRTSPRPRSRPRLTSLALTLAVALTLTLFAACGSSGGSSSSGDVTMKNLAFTTKPVKVGATVTVQNKDDVQHTVTADDGHSFDVTVDPGKSATFTAPSKAGDYKFHCNIHTQMHGTLTVQ